MKIIQCRTWVFLVIAFLYALTVQTAGAIDAGINAVLAAEGLKPPTDLAKSSKAKIKEKPDQKKDATQNGVSSDSQKTGTDAVDAQTDTSPTAGKESLSHDLKMFSPSEIQREITSIDWQLWLIRISLALSIIAIAIFIWKTVNTGIQKHFVNSKLFHKLTHNKKSETAMLIKTVVPIIRSILHWALILVTTLIVLSVLGVDTTPFFVSFSVVLVAFSFGSQALVKDLINGILTLFEGNMAVGDTVSIGKSVGTVETMSLRAISLRHFTGELQTIPFSEASTLTNCSRDFSYITVSVTVAPHVKMRELQTAYDVTYKTMQSDAVYGSYVRSNLGTLSVRSMTNAGIVISASMTIIPDPRKNFLHEFNRRLFEEMQRRHIPFAFSYPSSEGHPPEPE